MPLLPSKAGPRHRFRQAVLDHRTQAVEGQKLRIFILVTSESRESKVISKQAASTPQTISCFNSLSALSALCSLSRSLASFFGGKTAGRKHQLLPSFSLCVSFSLPLPPLVIVIVIVTPRSDLWQVSTQRLFDATMKIVSERVRGLLHQ